MRKSIKQMLSVAAVMAFVGVVMAAPASAAEDRLTVKNTAGSVTFKVQDTGTISGQGILYDASTGRLGLGLNSGVNPAVNLHVQRPTAATMLFADGYNASNVSGPTLSTRSARGPATAPTPSQTGDMLGAVNFRGYAPSGWAASSRAAIFGYAEENYTDTAQGSSLTFETTAPGTLSRTFKLIVTGTGNIGIGTPTPTTKLHVSSDRIRVETALAPAQGSACNAGDIAWGSDYVYVCTGLNTWKRAALLAY